MITVRRVYVAIALVVVAGAFTGGALALGHVLSGKGPLPPGLPPSVLGYPERGVSIAAYKAPAADYKRIDAGICSFPVETHEVGTFETLLFRNVTTRKLVRIERGVTLKVTFTNVVNAKSIAGTGYRQQTLHPNVTPPQHLANGLTVYHWQFRGLSLLMAVPKIGPVSLATGTEDVYFKLDRRGNFVSYYGTYQTPPWPGTYFNRSLCRLLS